MQSLEELVQQLKTEIDTLRSQIGVAPTGEPSTAVAPVPTAPAEHGGKIFNPDIGMIGNFVSATGKSAGGSESIAPIPFAKLLESEMSLQAIIDPYARADFFLAIGEEGIEVEEGYATFTSLPAGLRSRWARCARILVD